MVLLALGVTAINEGIARVLSLRSKQLWKALHQMVDGQEETTSPFRSAFWLWTCKWRPKSPVPAENPLPATGKPDPNGQSLFMNKVYGTAEV
jgi:hypothetical protein